MTKSKQFLSSQLERGATLIEVLVAVFLLTIGLLAMAALTASATGYNKTSQMRGTAVMLINDYTERARANLSGFDRGNYTYDKPFANALPALTACDITDPALVKGVAADCLGKYDQADWLQTVAARLPQGRAYVLTGRPAAANTRAFRTMDIWLAWREQQMANIASTLDFTPGKCPAATGATAGSGYRCIYFRVVL